MLRQGRRATEWLLTMFPVGEELPTKDFMRWPSAEIDGTGRTRKRGRKIHAKTAALTCPGVPTCRKFRPYRPTLRPLMGRKTRPHIHL